MQLVDLHHVVFAGIYFFMNLGKRTSR